MGEVKLRPDLPYEAQMGLKAIEAEYMRATRKYGPFASAHEGWAVIREELDELWDAIKANAETQELRKEAIQIGAMALRFLTDAAARFAEEGDGRGAE